MTEKVFSNPDVYRISVPLPENPLRNLNSYVIKTPGRNMIIDTGFNRSECYDALMEGLKELEVKIEDTDFFITHLHGDHSGLVNKIAGPDSKIYMSEIDYRYLKGDIANVSWVKIEEMYTEEGFPQEITDMLKSTNQAKKFMPDKLFEAQMLSDGEIIKVGDYEFRCILTPGHTPGHMCLYFEDGKLLFSGDHVLFDITPNITSWYGIKDSLKDYLESLKMINKVDIKTTLSGHRESKGSVYDRIDEILEHHRIRLDDTVKVIRNNKDRALTAYEIAQNMQWNLRGKSWDDFPENQKWFAMGETMSHLDYLLNTGTIYKENTNGIFVYYLCQVEMDSEVNI
ncbi:MAG: MBL fold metallo-hydrolase [Proteocatella sp.]